VVHASAAAIIALLAGVTTATAEGRGFYFGAAVGGNLADDATSTGTGVNANVESETGLVASGAVG